MPHTPGPWGYERIGSGEFLITDPGPPLPGFKVSAVGKMGLNEDDARLAAAAPDLLAFADEATSWLGVLGGTKVTEALASRGRMAIAKARGNQ